MTAPVEVGGHTHNVVAENDGYHHHVVTDDGRSYRWFVPYDDLPNLPPRLVPGTWPTLSSTTDPRLARAALTHFTVRVDGTVEQHTDQPAPPVTLDPLRAYRDPAPTRPEDIVVPPTARPATTAEHLTVSLGFTIVTDPRLPPGAFRVVAHDPDSAR